MQILPSFVYLAPLTLAFLIGPAAAIIATVIYAAPPVIRLTAHGIRSVACRVAGSGRVARRHSAPGVVRRAAADGQAHHRARHQPDHHGRAGDGDDRRADRRAGPRPGGDPGVVDPGRRHRIQRRSCDRAVGHHPGPDHHGRERARRDPTAKVGRAQQVSASRNRDRRRRDRDRDLAVLHLPAGGALPVVAAARVGTHSPRCRHAHRQRRERRNQLGADQLLRGDQRHQGRGDRDDTRSVAEVAGQLTVVAHLRRASRRSP